MVTQATLSGSFSSSKQVVHRIDTGIGEAARAVPTVPPTSSSSRQKPADRATSRSARPSSRCWSTAGAAGFTVREFELFLMLAERLDSVVQRPEIYELMWGGEMPRRDRSVDVLVRKVRAKLEQVAPDWRYIHTHFGIGYRFTPEQL